TNIFNVGAGGAGGSSPGVSGAPGISAPIVGAATEATPSITLVSPDSGEAGDTVTILGSNFGPTPADNKVCFGLGQAAVLSANTDSLTVEVPAGASSGRIKVTVDSLETYSPAFFTVGSGCAGAKGDMNASGGLSPADVVLMLNCVFLASGSCDLCFADVNCSGGLSPADVVIELNMVFLGAGAGC
ncbi:MAG TPA: IPT/TIG domain-containing protein, partial [Verrucomicrobiae bacterium]|nr:IPT/TIG domain-containing protein [Verrucomicrobiae bacterium]